jgi:hypothetical protein
MEDTPNAFDRLGTIDIFDIVVDDTPVRLSNVQMHTDGETVTFDYALGEENRHLEGDDDFEARLQQTVITIIEEGVNAILQEMEDSIDQEKEQ